MYALMYKLNFLDFLTEIKGYLSYVFLVSSFRLWLKNQHNFYKQRVLKYKYVFYLYLISIYIYRSCIYRKRIFQIMYCTFWWDIWIFDYVHKARSYLYKWGSPLLHVHISQSVEAKLYNTVRVKKLNGWNHLSFAWYIL